MTESRLRGGIAVAVLASCTAMVAVTPSTATTPSSATKPDSATVRTALPSSIGLTAVSVAPGTSKAWAVGNASDGEDTLTGTILRDTGTGWATVGYPAPAGQAVFSDVTTGSPKASWVIGNVQNDRKGTDKPIVLHSTGGRFTGQSLPGPANAILISASASSPTNAWIVANTAGRRPTPRAYRLTAGKWRAMPLPPLARTRRVVSVSTSGSHNTWVLAPGHNGGRSVMLHWNGQRWAKSRLPDPPARDFELAIATSGPHNAWVVGFTAGRPAVPLSWHWNGRRWTRTNTPNQAGIMLFDVATYGHNAVAVGFSDSGAAVMRYASGKWRIDTADQHGDGPALASVAASSRFQIAVGENFNGTKLEPLIEIRDGSHWRRAAV
ncbi:MAG TPA: hypothetical protein VHV79_02720 [Mycobacteriales bacterium]|jgi:hypothetical protein|nr:hypothetical protein [Mycobacteriales bacterium]